MVTHLHHRWLIEPWVGHRTAEGSLYSGQLSGVRSQGLSGIMFCYVVTVSLTVSIWKLFYTLVVSLGLLKLNIYIFEVFLIWMTILSGIWILALFLFWYFVLTDILLVAITIWTSRFRGEYFVLEKQLEFCSHFEFSHCFLAYVITFEIAIHIEFDRQLSMAVILNVP